MSDTIEQAMTTWYNLNPFAWGERFETIEVARDTPTTLVLADGRRIQKRSYHRWFPTREEAIEDHRAILHRRIKDQQDDVTRAQEELAHLETKLAEFNREFSPALSPTVRPDRR